MFLSRIRKFFIITLGTFCYVGYLPFMPGTFGSIAGVVLFYLIRASVAAQLVCTAAVILLGFLVSGKAERLLGRKDAPLIVIDETSGMLLCLIGVPSDIKVVIIAFLFFRILDTLKPYPAGRLQNLKGSAGIMADDLVAGVYTNSILQVVLRLASLSTS